MRSHFSHFEDWPFGENAMHKDAYADKFLELTWPVVHYVQHDLNHSNSSLFRLFVFAHSCNRFVYGYYHAYAFIFLSRNNF